MKYKIIYGCLEYDSKITEDIFNKLVEAAENKGCVYNQHWPDGGKTYKHFKKLKHLNLDPKGKKYESYGPCWVIDNNPQGLKKIKLEDLEIPDTINNTYQLY